MKYSMLRKMIEACKDCAFVNLTKEEKDALDPEVRITEENAETGYPSIRLDFGVELPNNMFTTIKVNDEIFKGEFQVETVHAIRLDQKHPTIEEKTTVIEMYMIPSK